MSSTIAALSTPNGESAIALVRLSGGECLRLSEDIFKKGVPVPRKSNRASYKSLNGEILDDCVFTFFKGPASYTGEDMLEIATHGNPFIVQCVLEDLFERGCVPAEPGEFTRRAFMNDKMDLSQAEGVALLISARSQRSLNAARRQLMGALGERVRNFCDRLMDISALIEAYIDFPEDDLPPEDKSRVASEAEKLSCEIQALIDSSKYTPLIHQGLNIVIAGAPNAGKSSLMNELLGHSRAIVSPKAGTTRDFIDEKIIIDGCSANLTDTAGLRNSDDAIESAGISKALEKISACDVCLLTIDVSDPKLSLPQETQDLLSAKNTVVVLNKCDAEGADPDKYKKIYKEFACVETSCRTHQGISSLRAAISQLIKSNSILPAADDILVSSRHAQALSKAKSCLMSAAEKTIKDIPSELVASDVREALNALGEITGKADNEQILDRVFSKFCIGK